MTKREAAIVSAYTGILLGNFSDMHKYIEEKLGRPVQTIEFASQKLRDRIKEITKDDFINMEVK